ncbi:unnamed protein product [Echinostoma caproni]|uniref:SEA domain-containing protein n=1 Tax=Echinostoma caproni TaxID=27848 RepID=A0A183AKY3_9TREM|nr:unnamed protein product [Echinostoma caproni]
MAYRVQKHLQNHLNSAMNLPVQMVEFALGQQYNQPVRVHRIFLAERVSDLDASSRLGNDLGLVESYYGSEFLGFGNGTLMARIKVKFDLDDAIAKNYSESMIRQHIVSGGMAVLRSEKAQILNVPTDFGVTNTSYFTLKDDGLIIFTFILVGSLVSMLIFLLCGCRRTIWYRYKNRGHPEHLTLVNMPSNYDI